MFSSLPPDLYRETFDGTKVSHGTRSKGNLNLTYIEYDHDPDPSATTMETVFVYFRKERGHLQIEQDIHITGLFPLNTWGRLISEAGFEVQKRPYPVYDDGQEAYLLTGVLR